MANTIKTNVNMRDIKLSAETRELIDAALETRVVQKCIPTGVTGNEASRATRDHITKLRRQFRKNQRLAAKT